MKNLVDAFIKNKNETTAYKVVVYGGNHPRSAYEYHIEYMAAWKFLQNRPL